MTVQSVLPPMPTHTHVDGVALGDIIPSPCDWYIEASHKEEKGITPALLTYICG